MHVPWHRSVVIAHEQEIWNGCQVVDIPSSKTCIDICGKALTHVTTLSCRLSGGPAVGRWKGGHRGLLLECIALSVFEHAGIYLHAR